MTVASAHRTPGRAARLAEKAQEEGIQVIIAGAGAAAHLAGVLAAHTILPVIGVPINSSPLNGWDALLSTVQMPPGVPVATMAVGKAGSRNAAILAAQIMGLQDAEIQSRLKRARAEQSRAVEEKAATIEEEKV
jgi:phosphoribosylaminoimidazole carboxylase PurE protein